MADAPLLAMDVLQWARHFRNFPGQGQFDLDELLRAGAARRATPARCRSRSSTTSSARRRTGAPRSTRCARCSTSRARPRPARARARGRAATARAALRAGSSCSIRRRRRRSAASPSSSSRVDDAAAPSARRLLRAARLPRAGRHRSKAGRRCSGKATIHLVVNAEPDSFARARFDEHGPWCAPSACATDDPARAVDARRRAALGALRQPARHRRAAPAGDALARRHLVHFVPSELGGDGLAAVDFVVEPRHGAALPAPACGASTMSRSAWRPTSSTPGSCSAAPCSASSAGESLELADPFGLVRSCGVANARPQRAHRPQRLAEPAHAHRAHRRGDRRRRRCITSPSTAPTSSPPSQRCASAASRFVADLANYYDDLLARFDTRPGAASSGCAARHPLRPRRPPASTSTSTPRASPTASSSRSCSARGYDAYGALNAPARMASQAQADAEPEPQR